MQPPKCIGVLQVVLDNQKMVWASKDSNKIMSLILEVHFVDIAMQLLYQMHNLVALAKEVLRLVDFY